ncbi:MAG: hypothetical protein MJ198_05135 [Bacteroidales bacterium]|nr:hypothetical protein [Bacteroidales bacterium]
MNSIKTANILLIVILVILVGTTVWSTMFVKNIADEKEVAGNKKNEEDVKSFLGTKTLARKIVR